MRLLQSSMFTAVACALTVSVSAQTPPPAGTATQPTPGAKNQITITGCLERGKEDATKGERAAFVLINITPASPATAEAAGTSGSDNAATASSYRLDEQHGKLSPHVGHKVELTGTVEDRPMGTTGTPAASGSAPEAPKFKVETVKMIASSCTA